MHVFGFILGPPYTGKLPPCMEFTLAQRYTLGSVHVYVENQGARQSSRTCSTHQP